MKCVSSKESYSLSIQRQNKNGWNPDINRNFGIKILLDKAPKSITLNSIRIKKTGLDKPGNEWFDKMSEKAIWSWDKETNTCRIKWLDKEIPTEIVIHK